MCNEAWIEAYPNTEALFHPEGDFDHSPVIMTSYPTMNLGRKPFRYFAMWKNAVDFEAMVAGSWNSPITCTPMFRVVHKLKRLKGVLTKFNEEGFHDLQARL